LESVARNIVKWSEVYQALAQLGARHSHRRKKPDFAGGWALFVSGNVSSIYSSLGDMWTNFHTITSYAQCCHILILCFPGIFPFDTS
jgi:hypothetical protein